MSEKNTELQTYNIDIEDPTEDDSFLEVTRQVEYDDHGVPYTAPYAPPAYHTTSPQRPWGDKRREIDRMPPVYDGSQGPLLTQEIALQHQFYPTHQYIVRQGTQPIQGGYIDTTKVQYVTQPVPNAPTYCCYFFWSLIVCILCAWPCGIAAIVYSNKAKRYAKVGQYAKAKSNATCALFLIIASFVFGLISYAFAIAKILHKI